MMKWIRRGFKFLSSVKLAIPLLLVLMVTVAYGTIVESRYNTEMAQLVVYHTPFFRFLLCLLWLNILCAALSRYPFRGHHTGFLVTHAGMLTLLIGALLTNIWGIDGQLPVPEKGQNNVVLLPELSLELTDRVSAVTESFPIARKLERSEFDDFNGINDKLAGRIVITNYLPFTKSEKVLKSGEEGKGSVEKVALSFRLKSAFFDVSESLSTENTDAQLGPAHLSLVVHKKNEKTTVVATKKSKEPTVQVLKDGSVVKELKLSELKRGPVEVASLMLMVTRVFEQALVDKNKITEGGQKGANPALEISVGHQGKKEREILYSKFPAFSLHSNGVFGYTFRYIEGGGSELVASGMPNDSVHSHLRNSGRAPASQGNTIQFHVYESNPGTVELKLSKNGDEVLKKTVKPGESVQTPWMGIELTLKDLVYNGTEKEEVKEVQPELRNDMPPSALELKAPQTNDSIWVTEGETRTLESSRGAYDVYYGRKTFKLPFQVSLEKFTKRDYPGTETPLSFESEVKINDGGTRKIAMNEPLTAAGFTLYQASYSLRPGEPAVSIFSVNSDPGRYIKYIGSLILVLGIITFTLQRSRVYKRKKA